MNNIRTIKGGNNLKGKVKVPGDKSISHRALIIGSIAEGETTIEGFLHSEDPLSTADCLRKLGISFGPTTITTITIVSAISDQPKENI